MRWFTSWLAMLVIMSLFRAKAQDQSSLIPLPAPTLKGEMSLEQSLQQRRSIREYQKDSLTLAELSQLLWAAQGVTHGEGMRTAPSAGALYPLEVYAIVGQVEGLSLGIYQYKPREHALQEIADRDRRSDLAKAALGQSCVRDAPLVLAITAVYQRTTKKYAERGVQYAHIEVGAAAQNVYLQATALGLGTVYVGAFHDDEVSKVLNLGKGEQPLALLPVGRAKL